MTDTISDILDVAVLLLAVVLSSAPVFAYLSGELPYENAVLFGLQIVAFGVLMTAHRVGR